MMKTMELYVHYPFCAQKCRYCDFLSAPAEAAQREGYMEALMREIRLCGPIYEDYKISTVFIGGGTPSIMSLQNLNILTQTLHQYFNIEEGCEFTIEANPGTLTDAFLEAAVHGHINRISLGLQSACDKELKYLGRIHTFKQFEESFFKARTAGIQNINVDLMSGLPGQTLKGWTYSLEQVIRLKPEHISAYSLIIEEGTPFYQMYGEDRKNNSEDRQSCLNMSAQVIPLPDEDTERQMYILTEQLLGQAGYHRYEISNYARTGRACRHNIGYWRRENYLGLGLGAASMIDNVRFSNTQSMESYMTLLQRSMPVPADLNSIRENICVLDQNAQMEEFMFLGLRMTAGISNEDFQKAFGRSLWQVYGLVIQKHRTEGLLRWDDQTGRLYLTRQGLDLSNYVLSDFLF